jgi:ankyrin repeat protein
MLLPLLASLMLAQDMARQPPLIAAIQKGSLEAAKAHLAKGADPNSRVVITSKPSIAENRPGASQTPGETALDLAVDRQSEPLVKLLLDYKANPNLTSPYGWTPLMSACQRGSLPIVKLLLKRGAKPNLRNVHGDTAIIFAANTDRVEMVRALLDAGADINGGTGQTALQIAVQSGAEKSVRYLLSKGANPNFKRPGYRSAMEMAEEGYDEEVLAMLKKAGGKARSAAELKKLKEAEAKRWRDWEAAQKAKAAEVKADAALLPDDGLVLQIVALDMLTGKERSFLVFDEKAPMIVAILPETFGKFNEFTESQMNGELDERKANDIDLEMRRNWRDRNQKPATLDAKMFSDPRVVVRKVETRSLFGRSEIPKGEAQRGWIHPMLPAYSADGNRAMVRLWFGPSAHGAAATYFLRKKGSRWEVVWRDFAFYV